MKITLSSETSVLLEEDGGPMTIEAPSADEQYSPFHMLGSALAFCTYSVLQSWAGHASLDAGALRVEVTWRFAESPHRVGDYQMRLHWPGLPPTRRAAATRAAALCAVHATLSQPTKIEVRIDP